LRLQGKIAVVTGGAGGIGAATAARLCAAGARVLIALVNAVGGSGRRFGDGPVADCTEAGWDYVLDTNLKSVFLCCKHAIPLLRKAGGGSIVNMASVLGLVGHPLFATHAYAAAKGGVIALTRAMAVAYAPEGIRVNALCPGLIDTPMSARAAADPEIQSALPNLQPLTGAMGRPDDVAEAALFLASDAAAFISGCVLPVDGGWTAR
jgi:NAD(P)-dependent dehydrogenase (short-subunit alcohol dehydrogenase family)